MSKVHISPEPEQWIDSLEPINVTFIAYDDYGIRIRNKQFYIKYDITYDNSEPNIDKGQKLYSNKDGIIYLSINSSRCRLSLRVYMVATFNNVLPESDEASYYEEQIIYENKILPFEPYITSFEAEYISDKHIPVNSPIPRKYVEITVTKSNFTTAKYTIQSELRKDHILTPSIVKKINEIPVKVTYYDPMLDKTWESDIVVVGKPQEIGIEAIYLGKTLQIGSLVTKEYIYATLIIFDGEKNSNLSLTKDQWEFAEFPQIDEINLGVFHVTYNNLQCPVKVPFDYVPPSARIEAWYEGPDMEVGKEFDPYDLRIFMINEQGLRLNIDFNKCSIQPESREILQNGFNWFTVVYNYGIYLLKDKFVINGYTKEENYDKELDEHEYDFCLIYYDPNTHSAVDVTAEFNDVCRFYERRYFNWQRIFTYITQRKKFGKYRLKAPELTGLSMRFITEWILRCYHDKAFKAELIDIYNRRE
jgi:hypothetical protein